MRALLVPLLLAGCGQAGDPGANGALNMSEIERLSTPREVVTDPEAPVRLQPLTPADLANEGLAPPSCDFSRDGHMLLAVTAEDAIARVGGTLRHFTHSSQAGQTGGFFEDRQVSVSVGRVGAAPPEANAGSWPARITVTNRRAEAQIELDGYWSCRGGA
jgi:hypothetical protein